MIKVKYESENSVLKLNIQKINIMASGPITSWQIDGKQWKQWQTLFSWPQKSLQMLTVSMKLKDDCSLEEKLWLTRQNVKKQRHCFADKIPSNQRYGFSSTHVWMCELDHKNGECQRIDAFYLWCWRRLKSPLDSKEIKPVNPKGNQSWIFIGRIDAEAEAAILWPTDVKKWLIGKDPDGS